MAPELNATVTKRSEINHGLLVLQVEPDFELPEFKPGQYTVLGMPGSARRIDYAEPETTNGGGTTPDPDKLIKRAYSIASSSLEGEYLEFYVALVSSGALTPRLFALEVGDRVFLGKKMTGMFTLDDAPPGRDILFVATGTGLAPYLSMLRSAYRFEERTTVVMHGARVSWDLGYRNNLEGLAAAWPRFHYLSCIDEPTRDPAWRGTVGRVYHFFEDGTLESLLGRPIASDRDAVFLCGHPEMIKGMEAMLGEKGFSVHSRKSPGSIFVEKYW